MNPDNRVSDKAAFQAARLEIEALVFPPPISISPSFMLVFIKWLIEILCIAQQPQPGEDITPFFVVAWLVELTAQK